MLKKLFTHSILYSLAPQISRIASILVLPILTRHLTPFDYGVYGVLIAYLGAASGLKELGLGVVFFNSFYRHPLRWPLIWRLLYGHLVLWGVVYSALVLVLLKLAMPSQVRVHFWLIAAMTVVPALLFDSTSSVASYCYRVKQQPHFIAVVSVLTGGVTVATTYYCIVELHLGYLGWFVASFASSLVAFVFYFYSVFFKLKLLPVLKLRKRFIKRYLKVSLPMVPHNYSSYLLNSSDRVVMNLYRVNLGQIGLYNVAYSFGNYMEVIGEAVGMTVGPFYSKLYSTDTEASNADALRLTFFLMGCFLAATFLASLWLKEVFMLLIKNDDLRSAYGVGIVIVMGYAYRPMYWSVGNRLSIFNMTSSLWKISFVAGLLNVGLNLLFVPRYGIFAAAISTLVSLLYIGFSGFYMSSYKKLKGPEHYPLLWIAAILSLMTIAYCLKDAPIPFKVLLTLGLVGTLAVAAKKQYATLMAIEV